MLGGWVGLLVATALGADPQPGPTPIILGALDRSIIDAVIAADLERFAQCSANSFDPLKGEVVVKFRINAQGGVDSAVLASSTLQADYVESCVVQEFYQLRFPNEKAGIVLVTYPFVWGAPPAPVAATAPATEAFDRHGPAIVRADRTWVVGNLDRVAVDAAVDAAAPGLARCIAEGLPNGAPAMGNLVARIAFDANGVALAVNLDDDLTGDAVACALTNLGRIRAKSGPGVAFVPLTLLP